MSADEVSAVIQALRAHLGILEVLTYRVSDIDTKVYLFAAQRETALGVLAQLSE